MRGEDGLQGLAVLEVKVVGLGDAWEEREDIMVAGSTLPPGVDNLHCTRTKREESQLFCGCY